MIHYSSRVYPPCNPHRDFSITSTLHLDKRALWALIAQHLSSTWGDRCSEFAFYLFLITLFKNTLLPASLFGFFTTGAAILFSGTVGSLVDSHSRLSFVRICIVLQKSSSSAAYALFLVLFLRFRNVIQTGGHDRRLVWILFTVIVFCGCVLKLATIGISVARERLGHCYCRRKLREVDMAQYISPKDRLTLKACCTAVCVIARDGCFVPVFDRFLTGIWDRKHGVQIFLDRRRLSSPSHTWHRRAGPEYRTPKTSC